MAAELEPVGVEGEDFNVVTKGDKTLIVPIRKDPDEPYHSDPQIRAFQMVQEGRIGGAGRGQGRKRKPRAAEKVAEEIRKRADKIVAAIDAGLDSDSARLRVDTAMQAMKLERDEALLQLKEEEADLDQLGKDELIGELIKLVADPSTEAQLEAIIDLPPEAIHEVQEVNSGDTDGEGSTDRGASSPAHSQATRPQLRAFGSNGRGAAPRNRGKGSRPRTARANGRASN